MQDSRSKPRKKSTIEHYNAVLIEEIRDNMKFIIEKVMTLEENLRAEFCNEISKQNEKLANLELIAGRHSMILKGHDTQFELLKTQINFFVNKAN